MELQVDNGAILAYRRLSYRAWYAIAEFVDNSTDSYFREINRDLMDKAFDKEGKQLEVEVTYDRNEGILRVYDNSIGMSESELEQAMIIGKPPAYSAGRSEFGMGMKTAAIWFADEIEIRTKKLGETTEIRTIIRVQDFVEGNRELETHRAQKPKDQHYTIVELSGLKRRLGVSAFQKTRNFLGSIYRDDIRSGNLHLTVNAEEIVAPPTKGQDAFMLRQDGTALVVDVDLEVDGRHVTGWIGVLKPGFTGRSQAGIALLRHGRAVRGWLDSWRPEEIFGDARNDTLNQRLAGELVMDEFRASHTKDAIDWEGDDEEELGKALHALCGEYDLLREAKKKTSTGESSPEDDRERQEAKARFAEQMKSQRVEDTIKLLDVPKPELARIAAEPLLDAVDDPAMAAASRLAVWDIGSGKKAYLYGVDLSPNDPYFEYSVLTNADLKIVINERHPALDLLNTSEARLAHYHHVALDAIAEWKCAQLSEPLVAESIRLMKDRLFRAVVDADESLE
ncbi:MAG: ATP-binding protein [Actinomycetes bacterium]